MATDLAELQNLWEAAARLIANSSLKASEYATPVLGLIFLRYAHIRFAEAHADLEGKGTGRRKIGPADYHAQGVLYVPDQARFDHLLALPEGTDLGKALNEAMAAIEDTNPDLDGVLPRAYSGLPNDVLVELLRLLKRMPESIEGDGFGLIYEYFLGEFALMEGQEGGEFPTPTSVVKLIVEIIEPYHGKIYDPTCGSGGMFVQSAHFVERHRKDPGSELSVYGQEKTKETVRLAKMNLAVHGLGGDIREATTYYEDLHHSVGAFDFVMADPKFNDEGVDKAKLEDDPRFCFGLPKPDNANYLWIQVFYSALNDAGRAGFVMANSASDARGSEMEIRRQLIQDHAVDVVVSVGSNFFYTGTLPATLWFLDRRKKNTDRSDKVLFIDARDIYNQVDRAHRDWTPEQIEYVANIARLWRDEDPEFTAAGSDELLLAHFPDNEYLDVPGLCAEATVSDIEAQGWSLSAGRYVAGVGAASDDFDFQIELQSLTGEFERLSGEAQLLTERIEEVTTHLLDRGV